MENQQPESQRSPARIEDGRCMALPGSPPKLSLFGPHSPDRRLTLSPAAVGPPRQPQAAAGGHQPAASDRRWVQKEWMALARAIISLFVSSLTCSLRCSCAEKSVSS